jgi:hypothetical protein
VRDIALALTGESSAPPTRSVKAYRRLFDRFGFKYPAPPTELQDRIVELAERLPARWQKFINESIKQEIEVQKELDDVLTVLETA